MSEAVAVFVNGTLAVFFGMGLTYAVIRITAVVVGRLAAREEGS